MFLEPSATIKQRIRKAYKFTKLKFMTSLSKVTHIPHEELAVDIAKKLKVNEVTMKCKMCYNAYKN